MVVAGAAVAHNETTAVSDIEDNEEGDSDRGLFSAAIHVSLNILIQ